MNPREKILAIAVGLLVAVGAGYMTVEKMLLSQARRLDSRAEELRDKIRQMQNNKSIFQAQAGRFDEFAARALGGDENRASEHIQSRLFTLLERCELGGENMSLTPQAARKVSKTEKEVSWVVSAQGIPGQLIDFLYLLNTEPYLRRVENITISRLRRRGLLQMKLRYMTLVLDEVNGEQLSAGDETALHTEAPLDSEQRELYDVIASRDLFRPYIKGKVNKQPKPAKKSAPRKSPKPPKPAGYSVVSLTTWAGNQEVHVREGRSGEVKVYRPGESLEGGKIAMIDYRKLPDPEKPALLSGSRVIIEIDGEYWAIELGQQLSKKRKLSEAQLPKKLSVDAEKLSLPKRDSAL
ncbi:MAG: hypothetical protein ACYSTL_00155 [Planctomycetota bacterium]